MHGLRTVKKLFMKIISTDKYFFLTLLLLIMTLSLLLKAEGSETFKNAKESILNKALRHLLVNSNDVEIDINDYNIGGKFLYSIEGTASWYGERFHNRKTANGETYNMYELTAAHRTIPFGTILRVTNLDNDKTIFVRINDRGPFVKKRIIDLSYGSASEIDGLGLPDVKIEGFLAKKKLPKSFSENEYYYGYSLDKPLVCLPESILQIFDSTRTFTKAVNKYEKFAKLYPEEDIYLMVPAAKPLIKEDGIKYGYYIATVHTHFRKSDKEIASR